MNNKWNKLQINITPIIEDRIKNFPIIPSKYRANEDFYLKIIQKLNQKKTFPFELFKLFHFYEDLVVINNKNTLHQKLNSDNHNNSNLNYFLNPLKYKKHKI